MNDTVNNLKEMILTSPGNKKYICLSIFIYER